MLNGKTALVTGSTSGIGHAIASVLVAEGCNVMLNGFGDAGEIEHMRSALAEAYDVTVAFSPADMGSGDEIGDLFEQLSRELGEVDILVNNAAAPESRQEAAIEDLPPERWDQAMAVNLSSAYHTSRLAIPGMKQRDWGRIVNIASSFGPVRFQEQSRLCRVQDGSRRLDTGCRAGNGGVRHHVQRDLPGLDFNSASGRKYRETQRVHGAGTR